MTTQPPVNYETVLTDLEARKAKIEAMIVAVKEFIGLAAETGGHASTSVSLHPNGDDNTSNVYAHLGVSEATEKYLKVIGQLRSTTDIVIALQRGGFVSAAQNFRKTISTILNQKARDPESDIVKFQGNWGLASWSSNMRRIKNTLTAGGNQNDHDGDAKEDVEAFI